MAKEFLPLFLDFNETTQDLSDEQCGRLVRALVNYAKGEEPELQGMELLAFRFLKGSIDRNEKLSAVRAAAGSKGGKQTQANASKNKQTQANETKAEQNTINNDNDTNNQNDSNSKSFIDNDFAADIQREHDRVFLAAEDSGFKMSNAVRERLVKLYAEYGLDKILASFMECATHGVPTIAYLEAVLKGTGKKKPAVKVLPAQNFPQRDYTGVDDSLMDNLAKEIEAMKAGQAG